MFEVLCCSNGKTSTVIRIPICQLILYAALIALHICAGIFLRADNEEEMFVRPRILIVVAGIQIIPFCLAALLFFGIYTKNYGYVRSWIFMKIFETVINSLILLSCAIYFAIHLEIYYAILLCALPIIIGLWMLESVVAVNVYYNSKTKSPDKNQFADPMNIYSVA